MTAGPARPDAAPVTAVIVHRNNPAACLATVQRLAAEPEINEILVVDNASGTGERAHLEGVVALGATIIEAPTNTGFGPGLNIGARRWLRDGQGDWLVLCPHDALLEPGGIAEMLRVAATRSRPGVMCADVADQATPHVDRILGPFPRPSTVYEGWEPADYPHGTFMMMHRDCLEAIGLFDERYFAYCDEADIGMRARKAGWEVGLVRGVRVENPTTSTAAAVIDHLRLRNTILLIGTHAGWWPATVRYIIGVVNVAHAQLRPSKRPPWFDAPARLRGLRDALLQRWGSPFD